MSPVVATRLSANTMEQVLLQTEWPPVTEQPMSRHQWNATHSSDILYSVHWSQQLYYMNNNNNYRPVTAIAEFVHNKTTHQLWLCDHAGYWLFYWQQHPRFAWNLCTCQLLSNYPVKQHVYFIILHHFIQSGNTQCIRPRYSLSELNQCRANIKRQLNTVQLHPVTKISIIYYLHLFRHFRAFNQSSLKCKNETKHWMQYPFIPWYRSDWISFTG